MWISRGALVLAAVMISIIVLASASTPTAPIREPIVIGELAIPTSCPGTATEPAAKVTGDAWCGLQEQIAKAGALTPSTQLTVGYAVALLILLLWIATGALIVSKQHRNLAGWVIMAVGLAAIVGGLGAAVATWAIYTHRELPALDAFGVLVKPPSCSACSYPCCSCSSRTVEHPIDGVGSRGSSHSGSALVAFGYAFRARTRSTT